MDTGDGAPTADGGGKEAYEKTTDGVVIAVEPYFLESHSLPHEGHYVWAYRVRIANTRPAAVKLKKRYWRIMDSAGGVQEVYGDGVVGEQPLIQPGDVFEYTSGAPLNTPSGMMCGRYEMETPEGRRLDVEIPVFSLDSPHEVRRVN